MTRVRHCFVSNASYNALYQVFILFYVLNSHFANKTRLNRRLLRSLL